MRVLEIRREGEGFKKVVVQELTPPSEIEGTIRGLFQIDADEDLSLLDEEGRYHVMSSQLPAQQYTLEVRRRKGSGPGLSLSSFPPRVPLPAFDPETMDQTQKRRMLAGELYVANDPLLSLERERCRLLLFQLNMSPPPLFSSSVAGPGGNLFLSAGDNSVRKEVFKKLFLASPPEAVESLYIEPPFYCDYGNNIEFGKNVYINFGCCILDCARVKIGDNTLIAANVKLYPATHPVEAAERIKGPELARPITIGRNCWLGGGCILLPGVTVGDNCVVGAGAVVTKDVPDNAVVVGNPARVLRILS